MKKSGLNAMPSILRQPPAKFNTALNPAKHLNTTFFWILCLLTIQTGLAMAAAGDTDSDNDGIFNSIDIDDDNDGILDTEEGDSDFDADGIINRLDLDADGDGINDFEESGLRESRQDPLDADGDGRIDAAQNFGTNGLATALSVADQPDYSGDGRADTPKNSDTDSHQDFLDLDSDNDGISDAIEAGIKVLIQEGRLATGQTRTNHPLNSDGDAIADYRDLDSDNDGVADIAEAGLEDSDGNGLIDNFNDSNTPDGYDDNAQAVFRASGAAPDSDGNGIPDYRECNCTGTAFHTGLKGHGLGSTDGFLLCLLSTLLVWRYHRRQFVKLATALLIIPLTVQAEKSPKDRDFNRRWYLGINSGMSFLDPEAQCPCYKVSDNISTGYSVFLGRDMSPHFSLEAYYTDLGKAGADFRDAQTEGIRYEHFGISALAYFYNRRMADTSESRYKYADEGFYRREGYSVFGRAGLGNMDNKTSLQIERVESQHIHLGLGIEYGWPNGFAGRAEFVSYDIDAKFLSFGILKRFGKLHSYKAPISESKHLPVFIQKPTQFFKSTVYFKDNTWELTGPSQELLNEMAETMMQRKALRILVRGHSNSDGDENSNLELSKRGAVLVARYLQSLGIDPDRIQIKALGNTQPVTDNETKAGKHPNRRVDFETIR